MRNESEKTKDSKYKLRISCVNIFIRS